jgi:DNA repair protein RadC
MPRGERYNPYQLPFDYSARPLEIGQHVREIKEPHFVRSPDDAAFYLLNQVFTPFEQFKQEQLYVLLLDNRNKITHDVMTYKGTVNSIHIRIAELFMEAVKQNAPAIILSHCHPSGNGTNPSPEDIRVTELAYQAGQLLQITLLDHLIIGNQEWLSLKSQGLGFPQL